MFLLVNQNRLYIRTVKIKFSWFSALHQTCVQITSSHYRMSLTWFSVDCLNVVPAKWTVYPSDRLQIIPRIRSSSKSPQGLQTAPLNLWWNGQPGLYTCKEPHDITDSFTKPTARYRVCMWHHGSALCLYNSARSVSLYVILYKQSWAKLSRRII